jgi:hypothetical protein
MVNRTLAVLLLLTLAGPACHGDEVITNKLGMVIHTMGGRRTIGDVVRVTNALTGFVAGSLPDVVWQGFHTNSRSAKIWEYWQLPHGEPATPPVLRWNTNSLLWGRKGMTAICQVWQDQSVLGQLPITALTRRHGYLRGHGMGSSGFNPSKRGCPVWFCTLDNQVIERKVQLLFVRGLDVRGQPDYSIMLFDADLPPAIEPMRVADSLKLGAKYFPGGGGQRPIFATRQEGFVSAGIPGWTIGGRAGDSGGPLMLPLPGELVFFGGQTTSPPTPGMQADMDMLSRKAGLDPSKYQMQWLNLDSYPTP